MALKTSMQIRVKDLERLSCTVLTVIMTIIYSIIKVLLVASTLFELLHAQRIPQEFRTKCTVAENEGCFTDSIKSCPPGFHQNNDYTNCTHRRLCCPCPQGTFQPRRNLCNSCIECKNCFKTSQEVAVRCNITHDNECGDILTTNILDASTTEELPEEEGTLLPDTSPAPDGDPRATTETPESVGKAGVSCAPTIALIFTHLACVLVGVILCNLRFIFQTIKSYASCFTYQPAASSLEQGTPKLKKKKEKKQGGKQRKQGSTSL